MKDLYLIGGGGHAKSCIDVIESTGSYTIRGIIDREPVECLGYPYIGNDTCLETLVKEPCQFLITVGFIQSSEIRCRLYNKVLDMGLELATIVSPYAYVSPHASIGVGTIVMHHALVNAAVTVGDNCIINTGALIEHDSIVCHHSHISTKVILNGSCTVGNRSFIGSGAVLKNNLTVGDDVILSFGSRLNIDIPDSGTYYYGK